MNDIQEIISLLKQYLENSIAPNGFLDNVVEYVLPIFSMLVVIIGGIWTVYTYHKGKNREINEKILGEVYAPMYQFFVKNDALTDLADGNVDYKEAPLLEWKKVYTEESGEGKREIKKKVMTVLKLSKEDFIEMMDSVNMGLAPQELITLFNIYKSVNLSIDESGVDTVRKARAEDYRTSIEYEIRYHAYSGYAKYCKKLGLSKSVSTDLFEVKEDCVKLKLPDSKEHWKKN